MRPSAAEQTAGDELSRYLEALGKIADGQATKLFLPMEFSGILGALGAVKGLFDDDQA